MREASHIVAQALELAGTLVKPGARPIDIDKAVDDFIVSKGGKPAFKGYRVGRQTFNHATCISINDAVVHGIPNERELVEGDIISVDVGVEKDGWFGDSAWTYPVGKVKPEVEKLLATTKESLLLAVSTAKAGARLFDISAAVQDYCEAQGLGVVRELVGHGIGSNLHEEPQVPNFVPGRTQGYANIILQEGMTIAIEPMINLGTAKVHTARDKWTILTNDGSPSAHYEHTIVIRKDGGEILTK